MPKKVFDAWNVDVGLDLTFSWMDGRRLFSTTPARSLKEDQEALRREVIEALRGVSSPGGVPLPTR